MGLIPFLSPISIVQQFGLVNMSQKLNFFKDFMLSGIAAGISKTAAAPIERVKLLVQNQDEMIKQGRLDKPYSGVMDCTKRTLAEEGITPFWRGNLANVIRYFPTQALNFAFKGQIKAIFNVPKDASYATKMSANIASGGFAGSLSLTVVYSLDYARTRRCLQEDHRFRRYCWSLQRFRHLLCRYLHLQRSLLRYLRYCQANLHW